MRVATRLVLVLSVTVAAVMVAYGAIALQQRTALIREGLIRETETLGRALQIVADNALRDGRLTDLDRVLGRVTDDPETFVAVMLDADGTIIAGGPSSALACVTGTGSAELLAGSEASGWVRCRGAGVRWVALPLSQLDALVLVGRRETVIQRDVATSRVRILLTTVVLAGTASVAILLVLRSTLSVPLAGIMRGVRSIGGPASPTRVVVPGSAGELRDLANAFNKMASRLEGKRQALVQEIEERLGLERRLRSSEKLAALGRVTGGLAHELGSPLNVIGVRAEAIGSHPAAPTDVRRQAAEILGEVDRIVELVRSLGHVARRHPIERRRVDMAALVEAVAEEARREADLSGIAIHTEVPVEGAYVGGDPALLRHAILNLTRNAVQALRENDGGHLGVRVEPGERGWRIVVEDDGPGIAPEDLPHLFEPFFTTRDVGGGMGLGLAITRGVAEEHGGTLDVEPRPEGGVRATLTLPADPAVESRG